MLFLTESTLQFCLQTDIQTSSQRFQLTASTPKDVLSPDESQDEVLSYEVKELGTHMYAFLLIIFT